ncbi:flavoprotein-like protein [Suillus cothurnatus]|nr:flavoprotein-like protein [Suillus cothurnatus]
MSSPRVAVIIYSMYGHIAKLAESVKSGVESAGGSTTIYQIAETLPDEVLTKMHAPPKPSYPIITPNELVNFDAFIFGVPTRYGNFPAQWKAFWDATGGLWVSGGVFVSTGTPGGGTGGYRHQLPFHSLSPRHHFCSLGYKNTFAQLSNMSEVRGGSPWGAGTYAGADGSRQPSALELELATLQGKGFWEVVSKYKF